MIEIFFIISLVVIGILLFILSIKIKDDTKESLLVEPPIINVIDEKTQARLDELNKANRQTQHLIDEIPTKVLNAVRGANNKLVGEFGEFAAHLLIRQEYDKVIYLGDVCDFVGFKYPTATTPGRIEFIEIKTGNAKLSTNQKKLKSLVNGINLTDSKKTNVLFRQIKIDDQVIKPINETETTKPD